jgi:hypothetical protein
MMHTYGKGVVTISLTIFFIKISLAIFFRNDFSSYFFLYTNYFLGENN